MVSELIAKTDADLIALPENFNYRGLPESELASAEPAGSSSSLKLLQDLAVKHKVSIMTGSHLIIDGEAKPYNRAHYINASGAVIANYSKIHLFDVQLESRTVSESASRCAGTTEELEVFTDTIAGRDINMAMAICYDLRFPELFRHYMFNCAKRPDIIFVPSAFSMETGKAHWEALLRARAIENSVYIVAPNQIGRSDSGFECYGNSMVIDPWGNILIRGSTNEQQILSIDIDLELLRQVRKRMPLDNRRLS